MLFLTCTVNPRVVAPSSCTKMIVIYQSGTSILMSVILAGTHLNPKRVLQKFYTSYFYFFGRNVLILNACISFSTLTNELCRVSSALTRVSLSSLLLAASVGHAVQTDQRSHDKERVNTGAHSAVQTNSG